VGSRHDGARAGGSGMTAYPLPRGKSAQRSASQPPRAGGCAARRKGEL
jgi:hypothetical protein